jgi:hypothetical protein
MTALGVVFGLAAFVVPFLLVIFGPSDWGFGVTFQAVIFSSGSLAAVALALLFAADKDRRATVSGKVASECDTDGELIDSGVYVSGHPSIVSSQNVNIGANASDFILVNGWDGQKLGTIPRSALKNLSVTDETQVETHKQQRVTVTRLAVMGPLALAAPKRTTTTTVHPKYILAVSWEESGFPRVANFKFDTAQQANTALAFFDRKRLPKSEATAQ